MDETDPKAIVNPPKHPGGRPPDYKPEFCDEIIEFFNVKEPWEDVEVVHTNKKGETWTTTQRRAKKLPTLNDFGRKVGVNYQTVWQWTQDHKEFSDAVTHAEELRKDFLIQNGLAGHYPPQSFKFVAVNLTDMRDSKDITTDGEKIAPQIVVFGEEKDKDENR